MGSFSFVKSHTSFGEFLGLYMLLYMALSGLANLMAVISPVSLFLICFYLPLLLLNCFFNRKTRNLIPNGVLIIFWSFGGMNGYHVFKHQKRSVVFRFNFELHVPVVQVVV